MFAKAVVVAIVLVGASPGLHAQTTDVALGIEALTRRDIRGADAAFARGTTAQDVLMRSASYQWRGHLAWMLRGDTVAAMRLLSQALATARDSSMVLLEIARLTGARRRYREAVRTAFEAMSRSSDGERRGLAARTLVSLAVDGAFAARRGPLSDSVDMSVLAVARDTLQARVMRFPLRTVDAMALAEAGALLGDADALYSGWNSYNAVPDSASNGRLAVPERKIGPGAPSQAWRGIGSLFVQSHLYEPAVLFMRAARADTMPLPAWMSDAVAYVDFTRAVRAAAEHHYRAALAGTSRVGDINRAIAAHGRALWNALQWDATRDGPRPDFYPAGLERELARRFGTVISVERSGDVDELHLAHRLGAHTVAVAGSTPATIVVLDGVVASGVDQWLLDGAGGRAAWVARDTIFERRTAFTETPYRAWIALNEPQAMPAEMLRIMRDSTADEARARADSLGFLPGVAARIFRDGSWAIADSLAALPRAPLPVVGESGAAAFARTVFAALRQSSVVLHEGRHIADRRTGRAISAVAAEFRAKVEEVSRADFPRLAMTAILTPKIGDASAHGQANRQVMRGLARWIRANGAAITGYDAKSPALLQLPHLTDAQLRAAFASMRQP